MIPVQSGTCTVYVETLEAAAAVAMLTSKRLVWRRKPEPEQKKEKRDER